MNQQKEGMQDEFTIPEKFINVPFFIKGQPLVIRGSESTSFTLGRDLDSNNHSFYLGNIDMITPTGFRAYTFQWGPMTVHQYTFADIEKGIVEFQERYKKNNPNEQGNNQ